MTGTPIDPPPEALYSPFADRQLDELESSAEPGLYNAVLDAVDHVLNETERARINSPGLRDSRGRPMFSTAVMYDADPRWFVFWNQLDVGPVILGVGPLPEF